MNNSLDVQMEIACNELQQAIRNERKVRDYTESWNKMALTCSQKKEYEKRWLSSIYANDRR